MEPPRRRVEGAARGPAEMGTDRPATTPGLPAAPARFRCPEDFCARRFAFCPESPAGAPAKRLLLIRAPGDFRPESLSGRRLALRGSPLLRTPQPDGSQKVYGLQATREESAARLLIAAGQPERLTCARPFGGSLSIQERDGEPGAPRPLFPVAERPPPRVPAGLKQRFFPFGARLKGPPRKAARERGRKRPLLPRKQALWQPEGPGPLLGGSPEPGGPRAGSKQRPLKQAAAAAAPAVLPGRDARPSGHLEAASSSEEPSSRRARKKKKRKAGLETEELPDPWQPEREPRLQGGREPVGGGGEAKEEKAGAEGRWGAAAIKEEPVEVPCLASLPEEDPRATREEPAGELPGCKKKKRRRSRSRERGAEGLWSVFAIKEEPGDVPCLASLPEEDPRATGEEPAGELPGCKKKKKKKKRRSRSRERGAEGLWSVFAIKEEPGDVPCLVSLPEEDPRATGEEPAGELPGCKKKKKKRRSRERGAEGLWSVFAIKEEPGDVPCLGSLPEEGLGSPTEEPGRELAGYIKQSPGKGAGGLGGVVALKEELGDVPSLGSLAEEGLGSATGGPAGELPGCKKKKKRSRSRERGAEGLWSVFAIKEEPGDVPCLGSLPEEGLGSPTEEPGRELAGYIKQSPGKGAGGLGGVVALKEELGDVPSLGSLAEEGLGVSPEDPAAELPGCKKKKKRGKLDKEPLQQRGTEARSLDWAAPFWQEPWQTNGAAPGRRPQKKKGRRREREDQAELFAAGT